MSTTTTQETTRVRITTEAAEAFKGDAWAPKDELREVDGHYELELSAAEMEVIREFVDPTNPAELSARIIDLAQMHQFMSMILGGLDGAEDETDEIPGWDGDDEQPLG